jgi:hypothetical protein
VGWPSVKRWREERERDSSRAEAEKIRVAVAQLDCADLYLAAAVNLELNDRDLSRLLDDLRREALWVRDELTRLRVVR